jgi:hypothetical protein
MTRQAEQMPDSALQIMLVDRLLRTLRPTNIATRETIMSLSLLTRTSWLAMRERLCNHHCVASRALNSAAALTMGPTRQGLWAVRCRRSRGEELCNARITPLANLIRTAWVVHMS